MYVIYSGAETLETASRIEYVKLQKNGKKVVSSADDFDFLHSLDSDRMYDKNIVYVTEADDAAGLASADQKLGRQITDLQLASIAQGQRQTALELAAIEQGQKITDVELEALKNV